MPCYLYLGIKYVVAPREFYSVGRGQNGSFDVEGCRPWA